MMDRPRSDPGASSALGKLAGFVIAVVVLAGIYVGYQALQVLFPPNTYETAMLATVADTVSADGVLLFDETYISGKYIPGIMGTLFSLVDKLVSSLSATVVGVAVSFIGLDSLPTQYDPYTPGMNVVVIVLFCVIPMIAWTATLLAMKNYSLTGEKMKEIQAVNACRRDAVAGGMSLEDAMQKWQTIDQLPAQYRAN